MAGISHFKLNAPKNTKHAALLAGLPATTSPEMLEELRKKLPNCTIVYPYTSPGSNIMYVVCLCFFNDSTHLDDALKCLKKGKIGDLDIVANKASTKDVKRIRKGLDPGAQRKFFMKLRHDDSSDSSDSDSTTASSGSSSSSDSTSTSDIDSTSEDDTSRSRKNKRRKKKKSKMSKR